MTSDTSMQAQRPNARQVMKTLGQTDCRTMMMEKVSEVPSLRVLVALLSTEDSNNFQKRKLIPTIHQTLAYPFFSLIRPLFLHVLPKGGRITEGLLYYYYRAMNHVSCKSWHFHLFLSLTIKSVIVKL